MACGRPLPGRMFHGDWVFESHADLRRLIIGWRPKAKTLEEIDALFEGEKHSSVPDIEICPRDEKELGIELGKAQLDSDLRLTNIRQSRAAGLTTWTEILIVF